MNRGGNRSKKEIGDAESAALAENASNGDISQSAEKPARRLIRQYQNVLYPDEDYDFWVHLIKRDDWNTARFGSDEAVAHAQVEVPAILAAPAAAFGNETEDAEVAAMEINADGTAGAASSATSDTDQTTAQAENKKAVALPTVAKTPLLLWHERNMPYSSEAPTLEKNVTLPLLADPDKFQVVYTMRAARNRDVWTSYDIIQGKTNLTRMMKPKVWHTEKNLMDGGGAEQKDDNSGQPSSPAAETAAATTVKNKSKTTATTTAISGAGSASSLIPAALQQREDELHWASKVDLRFVPDDMVHNDQTLSRDIPNNPLAAVTRFPEAHLYQPLTSVTDFWAVENDFVHLNGTQQNLTLHLSHYPTSYHALSIQKSLTDTLSMKDDFGLIADPMRESFMLKRIFLNNSPIVLVLSMLFMMTHSIFSWLAFKNDLSFWRKNKSMKGLSARSMVIGWVSRLVIALYLLDSRETSYLILFEIGLDLFLSTWKLTKAIVVEVGPEQEDKKEIALKDDRSADENEGSAAIEDEDTKEGACEEEAPAEPSDEGVRRRGAAASAVETDTDEKPAKHIRPSVPKSKKSWLCRNVIRCRSRHGYEENNTAEYDRIAIQYMSYILYPLMVVYTVYSLLYNTHRSWYSFFLKTCAGYIYMFGFIMMTPQLYINYRLQSVEHMPWRAMTYKALNTFVDDVSAFLMDMPWMHRLSCLRDDVIFLAYLYQRWIYRVDKTRPTAFSEGEAADPKDGSPVEEVKSGAVKELRSCAENDDGKVAEAGVERETSDNTANPRNASCADESGMELPPVAAGA
eukprot:g2061.t1